MLLPKEYQNKRCLALVSFGAGKLEGGSGPLRIEGRFLGYANGGFLMDIESCKDDISLVDVNRFTGKTYINEQYLIALTFAD